MMRPQPIKIALGGEEWQVRPLTLAQIQRIEPLLTPEAQHTGSLKAASEIVRTALERDHPQAASGLPEIEATAGEIATAMRSVLRLGGFITSEDDASSGEGQAGGDSISL